MSERKPTAAELKEDGNKKFLDKRYDMALACYRRALAAPDADVHSLVSILLNLGISFARTGQQKTSILMSLAASVLAVGDNARHGKALIRAASALLAEGHKVAAAYALAAGMKLAPELCAPQAAEWGLDNFGTQRAFVLAAADSIEWIALPAPSGSASASVLREQGNVLFAAGSHGPALELYLEALASHPALATVRAILSNISACQRRRGDEVEAAEKAIAAIALGSSARSFARLAEGLTDMGETSRAVAVCTAGLHKDPGSAELKKLLDSIGPSAAADTLRRSESSRQNDETLESRLESNRRMNEMVARLGRAPGLPFTLDVRVKPFHRELSRDQWPVGCEALKRQWQTKLELGYEEARSTGMHEMRFKEPAIDRGHDTDWLKRLGPGITDRQFAEWMLTPERGFPVRFAPRLSYGSAIRGPGADVRMVHSFGNAAVRNEILTAGKTHVAVGFVDLATLLSAKLAGAPKALKWYGFEAASHSVAKTMVIVAMLESGASVDDLLEVWYSATWTESGWKAFREAIDRMDIDSFRGREIDSEVRAWLHLWRTSPRVAIEEARKEIFLGRTRSQSDIANFVDRSDRVAVMAYTVSGDLPLDRGIPICANVTMFRMLPGYARQPHEHFLFSISQDELWPRRRAGSKDVVRAGVEYLRDRVGWLRTAIEQGIVRISGLEVAMVEPGAAINRRIRSLGPWTMSWSNVCDYMTPADFHRVARECSADEDTVHYTYSMNWRYDVKNSFVLDCPSSEGRMLALTQAKKAIEAMYQLRGIHKLLLSPPIDNALNIADYGLSLASYRKWVAAFCKTAGSEVNVAMVELQPYTLLSQANNIIYFSFTYDTNIKFENANTDGVGWDQQELEKAMARMGMKGERK
ncbi:hypothetical protein DFJ74DRAFT_701537 [Hyaloraphidium curvatum]|nr:hypothetical protein DFJ74DRAFT_701537 [Hyaloraphidium curvatum]